MPKITDFHPDPNNANMGTERGLRALDDSLREVGLGRSIVVDKNGIVLAGNKTQERAVDLGFQDAIVVPTDGKQLVIVQRTDLDLNNPDDTRARKLAYYDNRVADLDLQWNADVILKDIDAGLDLSNLFNYDLTLPDEPTPVLFDTEADDPLSSNDVPNALWPTDNDYGIPVLDINLQADALDQPVQVWNRKLFREVGTWLFYIDDDYFAGLWQSPHKPLNSKAVTLVEPNFSTHADSPLAVVLWQTYRKRWMARYWQSKGRRIFVDLNVNTAWAEQNLLGVPKGWKAYATRGYADNLSGLEFEYELACQHAGTTSILFVVYAYSKAVEAWCKQRGVLFVKEQGYTGMHERIKGKRDGENR